MRFAHDQGPPKLMFATEEDVQQSANTGRSGNTGESDETGESGKAGEPLGSADATPGQAVTNMRMRSSELRDAFKASSIPRRGTPILYRLAALIVALVDLTLPCIYFAIIAGAAYLTFRHATVNYTIMNSSGDPRARLFAYGAPLFVGIAFLCFLLKPLLSPKAKRPKRVEVTRETQPLLFLFIEQICKAIRAPLPAVVYVDCQVNASAGPRKGLFSVLNKDLALTVGLPLVSGLSMNEFAALLAHEFAHFRQGSANALHYLIYAVNRWFSRLVFERDGLDEMLLSGRHGGEGCMFAMTRLVIGITRVILFILMVISRALSCVLLRQQEYDADKHGACLAGADSVGAVLVHAALLDVSAQAAYAHLEESFDKFALAQDFPMLVKARRLTMPQEILENVTAKILEQSGGLFSTHPTLARRVYEAQKTQTEGIFALDRPATDLFQNYSALCREATLEHYRIHIGPRIRPESLMPNMQYEKQHGLLRNSPEHEKELAAALGVEEESK